MLKELRTPSPHSLITCGVYTQYVELSCFLQKADPISTHHKISYEFPLDQKTVSIVFNPSQIVHELQYFLQASAPGSRSDIIIAFDAHFLDEALLPAAVSFELKAGRYYQSYDLPNNYCYYAGIGNTFFYQYQLIFARLKIPVITTTTTTLARLAYFSTLDTSFSPRTLDEIDQYFVKHVKNPVDLGDDATIHGLRHIAFNVNRVKRS